LNRVFDEVYFLLWTELLWGLLSPKAAMSMGMLKDGVLEIRARY
jgi:hypothetical protein